MAFELGYEDFKWRWEPNFLGYQMSADIMSRQLIVPLISTNHLAFSASEPVGGMSDQDLEKVIAYCLLISLIFFLKDCFRR